MCVCLKGVNDDGVPYEEALCAESKPLGVMILGDSAGAHFHIPPEYLSAPLLSQVSFINFICSELSYDRS